MPKFTHPRFRRRAFALALLATLAPWTVASSVGAADPPAEKSSCASAKGQRVFSCGHSFHVFVPGILANMAKLAGIQGHEQLGLSSIGGSRVIQHWDVADEKNKAKEMLRSGNVDVLTLSPIFMPDGGIDKFATLALEHNPSIRITVQEIWLRRDTYEPTAKVIPKTVDHNAITGPELRERHAPLFQTIDEHVTQLNRV